MSFSIKFLSEPVPSEWGQQASQEVLGEITVGEFSERTAVPLNFWSKSQYQEQWRNAANKLLEGNKGKAVFITQFFDPQKKETGYVLECWPAYREGESVYIQNFYIPHESMPENWDINFEALIEERNPEDHGSEWTTTPEDIKRFQAELK
jgi:hypothetical protein